MVCCSSARQAWLGQTLLTLVPYPVTVRKLLQAKILGLRIAMDISTGGQGAFESVCCAILGMYRLFNL